MLSAHFDTRPVADQDKDPDKSAKPVMGANDGASGVAVLLELSRQVPKLNFPKGIALVFFDLEDHGAPTSNDGFCKGSQYMAAHFPPELQFEAGVNLDMVGDSNLRFRQERYSLSRFPDLTTRLWTVGASLYPQVFVQEMGPPVFDDHMPFLKSGKPYIDVIDFEYPSWHTGDDTADKCSAESLQVIGDVMLHFIQN
jgi:Zn-dependent M28 family amino/carboxypeptidase